MTVGTIEATETRMFDIATVPRVLTLAEKFTVPPFTVMNAAEGWWQDRKKKWKDMGIRSEVGRDARAYGSDEDLSFVGQELSSIAGGQSLFDPVLTELAYRWFCPPGGSVLDPFAGGSVRGVVAAYLGRHYTGIDLSSRQVTANYDNLAEIIDHEGGAFPGSCRWIEGNACYDIPRIIDEPRSVDFLFTCPPYFDLEVYSEDTNDLSVGTWDEFLTDYRTCIASACAALKPNRFAAIVVGEIRDKKTGFYRDFVGETIQAFRDAGLEYYNSAILVTPVGSIRMTVSRQFEASRKLGKRHQDILVFVKNDPKIATRACTGEIEPGVM